MSSNSSSEISIVILSVALVREFDLLLVGVVRERSLTTLLFISVTFVGRVAWGAGCSVVDSVSEVSLISLETPC